jgi:hypothetical protein
MGNIVNRTYDLMLKKRSIKMETSSYKKNLFLAIVIFVFFLAQPFTWAQKSSVIKSANLKKSGIQQKTLGTKGLTKVKKAPDVQVVNNSGENIYQAKVGSMIFSHHISSCSDGCSTGFKNINVGRNSVAIKIRSTSPWITLGFLDGFEKGKHYAVNLIKGSKDDEGCAVLFIRHQTHTTFNNDRTKEAVGKTCAMVSDGFDAATKSLPEIQVVNNSGIFIHQVKVGNKLFSRHIGSCTDGCSTGFKKIDRGSNKIFVKVSPVSPWAEIGTLTGFNYNRHYAVNIVTGREGVVCAELWLHHDTSIPFNENHVKEKTGDACSRFMPLRPAD